MKDKLKQLLIELVYWQNEDTPKDERIDYTYSQIIELFRSKIPKKKEIAYYEDDQDRSYTNGYNQAVADFHEEE